MQGLKKTILFLMCIFLIQVSFAQSERERKEIISEYDFEKLNALKEKFSSIAKKTKLDVLEYARENNIDILIQKDDGGTLFLERILEDGTPLYLETFNVGSAATINTNQVQEGGSLGLSLSGKNMNLGIWDGGLIRTTHQEFGTRVVQLDNPANLTNHGTHVSGTMIASGVDPLAKGMAYEASLSAYDFEDDFLEMTIQASNGMLISNHSYGTSPSSIPAEAFGAYIFLARDIDQIVYNAPNYLPVFAAGNSNNAFPAYNPTKNGYDLISGRNLAKNILSVANVEEVTNYTGPSSVNIWQTSSWGPTDDGRIKPDISAKGAFTYSSIASGDDAYSGNYVGTSMAAPAVSGSIALLQEHHNNKFGGFLSSASMRGLILHTAREAGPSPGPDYIFGWGLMDTAEAASTISNKNFTTIIQENTLDNDNTFTYSVEAIDANTALVATIAWTDPPGAVQDISVADDPTPRLVNDLDIKIIAPDGFTEFLPWTLDPAQPAASATTGDNIVDNIEKIEIPNAVGNYIIQIDHKGTLQNMSQDYSLIVSGIAENDFAINTNQSYKSFCANTNANFELNINTLPSFNSIINLSVTGLPGALTTNFSQPSSSGNGQSTLNINGLDAVSPGEYPFTVTAISGSDTFDLDLTLNIKEVNPLTTPILVNPIDDGQKSSLSPVLEWDSVTFADSYDVDFSDTQDFSNVILSSNTEDTFLNIDIELNPNATYYWRVRPVNECLTGNYSVISFDTKTLQCDPIVFSNETPINIPDDFPSSQEAVVSIQGGFGLFLPIEDVNVSVDISHTYISDLTITLTSPQGTTITLLDDQCSDLDDVDVVFDDKGLSLNCNLSSPALQGLLTPEDKLSAFMSENYAGDWTLTVLDNSNGDGGTINSFGLEICYEQILSVSEFEENDFEIYPNPSTGMVNLNFSNQNMNDSRLIVFDLKGRMLHKKQIDLKSGTYNLDLSFLQSGIYFLKLQSKNQSVVKKLILKK
jgi:subtilisin-like proprotein convertase family protein